MISGWAVMVPVGVVCSQVPFCGTWGSGEGTCVPAVPRQRLNTGVARRVVGFGEDELRALAGARSFERGLGYLDAVSGLEVGDDSAIAVVHGTDVYQVELILGEAGGISG